jgi:hypothetical protein
MKKTSWEDFGVNGNTLLILIKLMEGHECGNEPPPSKKCTGFLTSYVTTGFLNRFW